jgi:hypothetical protein
MSTVRRLASGGVAAGALLVFAAGVAMATVGSPSPGAAAGTTAMAAPRVEPTVGPPVQIAAPARAVRQTRAATPRAAATPKPAARVKPATTPKPARTPDADEGPIQTLSGTLGTRTDADGDRDYVLGDVVLGDVELSVGPPWFWGTNNPLEQFVGSSVTVTGRLETNPPSTNSNGRANDADGPEFEVYTVNGTTAAGTIVTTTVRAEGKPPWAGGPKAVGERHPGYKGWSQGQANRAKASARP